MSEKRDWKKFKEEQAEQEALSAEELEEESEEASSGALGHSSYVELEEKLTLAEQQSHENWEKAVRAMAELDNVRRRSEREIENAHRYGLEKLINAFIPVVDSLEQALQLAAQHADESMHQGLELTMKLFLGALEKCNVQQIDPLGMAFDPQLHEAMSMQVSADAAPNTVIAVFQKGYLLNERVIRPARVVVSKA